MTRNGRIRNNLIQYYKPKTINKFFSRNAKGLYYCNTVTKCLAHIQMKTTHAH